MFIWSEQYKMVVYIGSRITHANLSYWIVPNSDGDEI